jgi:hypothetical protein
MDFINCKALELERLREEWASARTCWIDALTSTLEGGKQLVHAGTSLIRALERSVAEVERERDVWRSRLLTLQSAASGKDERECEHDSITGGICDGCGVHIKAVRLDEDGIVSFILDYAAVEAEQDELRRERDRWEWVAEDLADTCWCNEGQTRVDSEIAMAIARYDAANPAPEVEADHAD